MDRMVQGLNPGKGKIYFSSPNCLDWLWSPPSHLFNRHGSSFMWVKRLGCDVNHSPPCSAKVKDELSYSCTPSVCHQWADRENFTFTEDTSMFFQT
jgi:hypothetical protein